MPLTPIVTIPGLNLPQNKVKGLIQLQGGEVYNFYWTSSVVKEGTPMKLIGTAGSEYEMAPIEEGEGALAAGLAMQLTYEESLSGQLGQLAGYHFRNDTAQSLLQAKHPIGLLSGNGIAILRNYEGTVVAGDSGHIGASGSITNVSASGSDLPIVFETGGTGDPDNLADSDEVVIRYSFHLV